MDNYTKNCSQYTKPCTCTVHYIANNGFKDTIKFKLNYYKKYELNEHDTFSVRIKKLRKLEDLTCSELGKLTNLTAGNLISLENNAINPSYTIIKKLYNYFGDKIIVDPYSKYVIVNGNELIKNYRIENKIKVKDMAKILNISERSYHKLEVSSEISLQKFQLIYPKIINMNIFRY